MRHEFSRHVQEENRKSFPLHVKWLINFLMAIKFGSSCAIEAFFTSHPILSHFFRVKKSFSRRAYWFFSPKICFSSAPRDIISNGNKSEMTKPELTFERVFVDIWCALKVIGKSMVDESKMWAESSKFRVMREEQELLMFAQQRKKKHENRYHIKTAAGWIIRRKLIIFPSRQHLSPS